MKVIGKLYGHLVYFTAISCILWPFGLFCGHFGVCFPFWYIVPRKIWQPWPKPCRVNMASFKARQSTKTHILQTVERPLPIHLVRVVQEQGDQMRL
jgi:hypothetical protein